MIMKPHMLIIGEACDVRWYVDDAAQMPWQGQAK